MKKQNRPRSGRKLAGNLSGNWHIGMCRLLAIAEGAADGSRTHTAPRSISAQATADGRRAPAQDKTRSEPRFGSARTASQPTGTGAQIELGLRRSSQRLIQ